MAVQEAKELAQREAQNLRLREMLEQVPGQPDDPIAGMMEQLLTAERIEDLDTPWNAEGLADSIGRVLAFHSIKRMVSDIEDGPGFYLVCSVTDTHTGEMTTKTTSSVMVMVQLIIAHTNGWLPGLFIPRKAEKATKRGYYPLHLEVYRGPVAGGADRRAQAAAAAAGAGAGRARSRTQETETSETEEQPSAGRATAAQDGPGF